MSVEAMVLALHHSRATGTAKTILLGIANHHGDGGAWPAMTTLAHYGNVSREAARRAVAKLEALGEVRRQVQAGGTHDIADYERPNRYDIVLRCPEWCDGTMQHRDKRSRAVRLIGNAPETPPTLVGPLRSSDPSDEGGDPSTLRGTKPALQTSTQTETESRVGERVRARRADGSTCWAIFDELYCVGIGITGQRHRYSERQGCCPDCGAVPTHRSAS